jgi:crotonobetainyl-CoA:carnitine CoA-transferase CaiB-like acyl-CoA transferase
MDVDEAAFRELLTEQFLQRDLADWVSVFEPLEACVEPVLDFAEAAASPLMGEREMVVDVPREDGASQKQIACPLRFSGTQAAYRHVGVTLGAHNLQVLQELGLTADEIQQLAESGALG